MAEVFRYAAFISYSSRDAAFAARLHRALESYGVPSALGTFDLIGGGKKNRIYPVFRDREELAAGQLGDLIEANLKASAALIVICSPASAASPWVQKEIEYFAGLGRRERIFAIIAPNAPLVDAAGTDATAQSFPPAFRADALADAAALEPLAADARKGKDGFRNAWLKVVAGLIGVTPGQIIDRDRKRRRAQRGQIAAATVLAAGALGIAAAVVDARTWRTAIAAEARDLVSNGRTLDAFPFAIAALAPPGALLPIEGGGREVIASASLHALRHDLGPVSFTPSFAPKGPWLEAPLEGEGGLLIANVETGKRAELPGADLPRFSPSGEALASSDEKGIFLYEFESGRRVDLGGTGLPQFSADGARLALFRDQGESAVYDVASGRFTPIGETGSPAVWRADAAKIAARGPGDMGFVVTLASGARTELGPMPGPLGALIWLAGDSLLVGSGESDWAIVETETGARQALGALGFRGPVVSPDGRRLAAVDAGGQAFVLDLDTDVRTALGPAEEAEGFAPDGRVMLYARGGESMLLVDPATGARAALAQGTDWIAFSPDGRHTLQQRGQTAEAFLVVGDQGAATPLGATYGRPVFSADGRYIAWRAMTGEGVVLDVASGRRARIGRLSDTRDHGSAISADGRWLAAQEGGGSGFVLDLERALAAPSDHCDAPVRSLAGDLRDATAALRGRPWNPCDWRGLAAILPDPARGDGWFEGPRQWWRLRLIRLGLAPDYACGEVNAAGRVDPAREVHCAKG